MQWTDVLTIKSCDFFFVVWNSNQLDCDNLFLCLLFVFNHTQKKKKKSLGKVLMSRVSLSKPDFKK